MYTWCRPSPCRSDRRLLHSPWDIHIVQTISSQVWLKTVTLTLRHTHGADYLTGLTEDCYTHPEIYTWCRPSPCRSDRRLLHSLWDIHMVQTISQFWQKTVTLTLRYTHGADHLLAGLTEDCYTHSETYTWCRLSHRSDRRLLHSPWDIHMVQTISLQVWQKTVTLTLRHTHGADYLTGLTEDCYTHPEIYT